jgi:hypothetical protein
MSRAKNLLFTFALAAVIMVTAVSTLGSAQPVEAAPDLSYQTYENYSDGTLFVSRTFTDPSRSASVYQPPMITWFWWSLW